MRYNYFNNNANGVTQMQDVTLTMKDELTGKVVTRIIDITNAMNSGSACYELGDEASQRRNLENWINERGNEQHETILSLVSWEIN
jgi:hypothetical protein